MALVKPPPVGDESGRHLLVAEKDALFGKALKIHLSQGFSKVTVASTLEEATDTLRRGDVDVIAIDSRLARRGAWQLMQRSQRFHPLVATVLMLANGKNVDASLIDACDALISFPFGVDALEGLVRRACYQHTWMQRLAGLVGEARHVRALISGSLSLEEICPAPLLSEAHTLLNDLLQERTMKQPPTFSPAAA